MDMGARSGRLVFRATGERQCFHLKLSGREVPTHGLSGKTTRTLQLSASFMSEFSPPLAERRGMELGRP